MRKVILLTLCALLAAPVAARADDWSDPDYVQHDLDNYTRARGRTIAEASSPDYHRAFLNACTDSSGRSAVRQATELPYGRVYATVAANTCWWSVGDAPAYFDQNPHQVRFYARTGAKLQVHIWGTAGAGPRPGVVITTGSIQAGDQMYWWAARALAAAGYVVMTFDVQGQGGSETFAHPPGGAAVGLDGVPSQQDANFYDGTIDAIRFFLSTPDEPYVPVGWSEPDVDQSSGGAEDRFNPAAGVLDRGNIGIIGHSLGASAVSNVQQCSDEGTLWQTLELCAGRSYPIRAVVAWDALSGDVTPVVPAMSQQSDGYFLFPTFSPTAPADPSGSLDGFNDWDANSSLDVFSYVVRAGTHIEWSQVPYTAATTYGVHMNTLYTIAWMHRFVWPDADVNRAAYEALLGGPTRDPDDPAHGAANYMSVRRYSAFRLTSPDGSATDRTTDIRTWAGRSAIGDWAAANADPAGRVLP